MDAVTWAAAFGAAGACRFFLRVMPSWAEAGGGLRPNYRGDAVPVAMGLAAVMPVTGVIALAAALGRFPPEAALALVLAGTVMASVGLVDDVWGDGTVRGVRAHLAAALRGSWTTGAVKAAVGAGVCLTAGLLLVPRPLIGALVAAGIVGASANGINLFDVRPGRAWKFLSFAWILLTLVGSASGSEAGLTRENWLLLAAAHLGVLAAYGPVDLRARAMMGDAGANGLGALLGVATVLALPPAVRGFVLFGWLALHVYCDRFSLTETIARIPWLRRIDEWGR